MMRGLIGIVSAKVTVDNGQIKRGICWPPHPRKDLDTQNATINQDAETSNRLHDNKANVKRED